MNEVETFRLNQNDRGSATWSRLLAHLRDELIAMRAKNDSPLDEHQTATLRGKIAMLKQIIELDKIEPEIEQDKS
jgi:hypothetical protein